MGDPGALRGGAAGRRGRAREGSARARRDRLARRRRRRVPAAHPARARERWRIPRGRARPLRADGGRAHAAQRAARQPARLRGDDRRRAPVARLGAPARGREEGPDGVRLVLWDGPLRLSEAPSREEPRVLGVDGEHFRHRERRGGARLSLREARDAGGRGRRPRPPARGDPAPQQEAARHPLRPPRSRGGCRRQRLHQRARRARAHERRRRELLRVGAARRRRLL